MSPKISNGLHFLPKEFWKLCQNLRSLVNLLNFKKITKFLFEKISKNDANEIKLKYH